MFVHLPRKQWYGTEECRAIVSHLNNSAALLWRGVFPGINSVIARRSTTTLLHAILLGGLPNISSLGSSHATVVASAGTGLPIYYLNLIATYSSYSAESPPVTAY